MAYGGVSNEIAPTPYTSLRELENNMPSCGVQAQNLDKNVQFR